MGPTPSPFPLLSEPFSVICTRHLLFSKSLFSEVCRLCPLSHCLHWLRFFTVPIQAFAVWPPPSPLPWNLHLNGPWRGPSWQSMWCLLCPPLALLHLLSADSSSPPWACLLPKLLWQCVFPVLLELGFSSNPAPPFLLASLAFFLF